MLRVNIVKIRMSIIVLFIITLVISCSTNNNKSNNKYKDGIYCSSILYSNPKTAFSNLYDLNIEIKENKIIKIFFKNGYIDEHHFITPDLSNGNPLITTYEGKIFNIYGISEMSCNSVEIELEPNNSSGITNYITTDEFVVFVVEGNNTIESNIYIPEEPKIIIPDLTLGVIPQELTFPKEDKTVSIFNSYPFKKGKLEIISVTRSVIDEQLDNYSKSLLDSKMNSFYFEMKLDYDLNKNHALKSTLSIDQVYFKVFETYNEAQNYLKELNTINPIKF
jgi:hypothetical protein